MGLSDFPTTVRLSREMRAAVRKEAKRQRRSMSWMMRDIFDQWFTRLAAGEPSPAEGGKTQPIEMGVTNGDRT